MELNKIESRIVRKISGKDPTITIHTMNLVDFFSSKIITKDKYVVNGLELLKFLADHPNLDLEIRSDRCSSATALEITTRSIELNTASIELIKRGAKITINVIGNINYTFNVELMRFISRSDIKNLPGYFSRELVVKAYNDLERDYLALKNNYEKLEKELELLHEENDELKKIP